MMFLCSACAGIPVSESFAQGAVGGGPFGAEEIKHRRGIAGHAGIAQAVPGGEDHLAHLVVAVRQVEADVAQPVVQIRQQRIIALPGDATGEVT